MVRTIDSMIMHLEALSPRQFGVLKRLGPLLKPYGFHLVGGTALALRLGHRRSVDLDWFTDGAFEDPIQFLSYLQENNMRPIVQHISPGTLHLSISGVRVSFLGYRYPQLQRQVSWKEGGCRLASLDDLACMKLSATAQRGSKKDFIDIYALIQKHRPLSDMLSLYQEKYGIADISHVLFALSYFDDADKERTPRMLWKIDWSTMKQEIVRSVTKIG